LEGGVGGHDAQDGFIRHRGGCLLLDACWVCFTGTCDSKACRSLSLSVAEVTPVLMRPKIRWLGARLVSCPAGIHRTFYLVWSSPLTSTSCPLLKSFQVCNTVSRIIQEILGGNYLIEPLWIEIAVEVAKSSSDDSKALTSLDSSMTTRLNRMLCEYPDV
jgi:hypothetical protein